MVNREGSNNGNWKGGLTLDMKNYQREKYLSFDDSTLERRREAARNYYLKNRKRCLSNNRERRKALRLEVLCHYSKSSSPHCASCGETDLLILCLDHINGGGSKEIKRGESFHRDLKVKGFPVGFQVLCANCNQRKRMLEENPHVFKY